MKFTSRALPSASVVLASVAVLALGVGTGAVAADLITSKDIANKTIRAADLAPGSVKSGKIKDGSVKYKDLDTKLKAKVDAGGTTGTNGTTGPQGPQGPQGVKGDKGVDGTNGTNGTNGADGTAAYVGANWSIIDRNVVGNGDAYLRSGPVPGFGATTGATVPMGVGSLGLRTGSPSDKVAFGNPVDFLGKALSSITSVSFYEYTTAENRGPVANNLASVAFEISPTGTGGYSTLNFVPPAIPANEWTKIEANTATWYLTGGTGTSTGCNQVTYCTLDQVKTKLPNATLYTAQITTVRTPTCRTCSKPTGPS